MSKYYNRNKLKRLSKEKALYLVHGKRYEIIVKHYITLSRNDYENVIKCNTKMLEKANIIIERKTRKIKMFCGWIIYLNTYYGGIDD